MASTPQGSSGGISRVCERCVARKVKCNLARPSCSRCLEERTACVYSRVKRRPGPSKGSRRAIRSDSNREQARSQVALPPDPDVGSNDIASPQSASVIASALFSTLHDGITSAESFDSLPAHVMGLTVQQQQYLVTNFFDLVHPSIPLLRRAIVLQRLAEGTLEESLLLTICVIAARVVPASVLPDDANLDAHVQRLLDTSTRALEGPANSCSLDIFQKACLLSFYEFHRHPGERAWSRISQLTRKAYQKGLHAIDSNNRNAPFNNALMAAEEVEEWRYVWWCIHRFDSYSNITSGTPCIVENDSTTTQLVSSSLLEPDATMSAHSYIQLPADVESIWETVKIIATIADPFVANFNMHIITTSLVKEAGSIWRLRNQNPSNRLQDRLSLFLRSLSAAKLALPLRYLDSARHALEAESNHDHHARLICILHIHAASLLAQLSTIEHIKMQLTGCLEHCQNIVSVVQHWDGQHTTSVDPAICFITFLALVILHLIGTSAWIIPTGVAASIQSDKTLLLLFLQQFQPYWEVPRLLLRSYSTLSNMSHASLTVEEIRALMGRLRAPLHPNWIDFTNMDPEQQNLEILGDLLPANPPADWQIGEWSMAIGTDGASAAFPDL